MKNKIHLKNRKNRNKVNINKVLILVISIVIVVEILLNNVSRKITPILFEKAEIDINNTLTTIINKAINSVIKDDMNLGEMFTTILDKDGMIQTIDLNPLMVNQVLNKLTSVIQMDLKKLEEGNIDNIEGVNIDISKEKKRKLRNGIISEIPMGIVFNNTVLSNLGPKIPIRLHCLGDIKSNIKTHITPYGINNALLELSINLEINAKILMPFISKNTKLGYNIPLIMKVIQGGVPNYYGSGLIKESSLYSIPFE